MTSAPAHGSFVTIGAFQFCQATGELRDGDSNTQRLGPQPAQLLSMLVARRGELVTHEEIRAALWPDVHVEFDQGLHHCIRQLRTALGDTASKPTYIETLPRRGYRLCAAVTPVVSESAPHADANESVAPPPRRRNFLLASVVVLAIGMLAILALEFFTPPGPTVVAIMPFVPPEGSAFPSNTHFIADHLLETLSAEPTLRVIGPSTTEQYVSESNAIALVTERHRPRFIINGRFIDDGVSPRMLAELIRTSDGAHVKVIEVRDFRLPTETAAMIVKAMRPVLVPIDDT